MLLTIAIVFGLTGLCSVVNERWMGLQQTIGLMLMALAMALSLPAGPEKNLILHMTHGVVAFSIIVQGLSIARIFKADALKRLLPGD